MKCGIKKYDGLPSRVEYIDVDMLRYKLYHLLNPSIITKILYKIPILNLLNRDNAMYIKYYTNELHIAYLYNKYNKIKNNI